MFCSLVLAAAAASTQEQLKQLAAKVEKLAVVSDQPLVVISLNDIRPWLQGFGMAAAIGFLAVLWTAVAIFVVQWRQNRVLSLISRSVEQSIPLKDAAVSTA